MKHILSSTLYNMFFYYLTKKSSVNFLSHFYFTQNTTNPYLTLGTILPDLFRNYNKDWKFDPTQETIRFDDNQDMLFLYKGWKLHIQVDILFHSSNIFKYHSSNLRKELVNVFTTLPKRPFFLAHVGYELILDNLLIRNKLISTNLFYQNLSNCNPSILDKFMDKLGIIDKQGFHSFLTDFINSRYLESYSKTESLVYALDRIGRRAWHEKFSEKEKSESITVLNRAIGNLNPTFLDVFHLLEKEIKESRQ